MAFSARSLFTILFFHVLCVSIYASGSDGALNGQTIKEIRISGLKWTKRYIITRELTSKVGEPYVAGNAQRDYERLETLGLFSYHKVEAFAERDSVVIGIEVKETFPHLPTLAFRISDEDGVQAGAGFTSLNLKGQNIRFSGRFLLGGATNVEAAIEDPWFAGNHLSYRVEFYQRDRGNEVAKFDETSTELYTTVGSYLGERGRIGGRFSFQSVKSDTTGATISSTNRDNVPSIGFFVGYDNRNLWINTTRGWWNEIEVMRSGIFGWGDASFWKLTLDLRRYQPIVHNHTLALFSLTTLTTGTAGVDYAPWQFYGLGGWNTIRGSDLSSRVGKNQMINTLEYRWTFFEPYVLTFFGKFTAFIGLQAVVFADLGHAWNEKDEFKLDNFLDGYGFGINILTPFSGMARVHLAWNEAGKSIRVGIRGREKALTQRQRVR